MKIVVVLGFFASFAFALCAFVLFIIGGDTADSVDSTMWSAAGVVVLLLGFALAMLTVMLWDAIKRRAPSQAIKDI
jgi:uncharacterized membrane protein YidH (DUF202 family)